jgi:hypothetical protein
MDYAMSKNQIRKRSCSSTDISVRKESLLHMLKGTGSHKFLNSLDVNKWKITSFDPRQRTACVEYDNGNGIIKSFTFAIPVPGVRFDSGSDESYVFTPG